MFYNDFAFQENGSIYFLSYLLESDEDPIPTDHGFTLFPWNGNDCLKKWIEDLEHIHFWDMPSPPPRPEIQNYLVLAATPRIHFVQWGFPNEISSGLYSINVQIRHWITMQFFETFGV